MAVKQILINGPVQVMDGNLISYMFGVRGEEYLLKVVSYDLKDIPFKVTDLSSQLPLDGVSLVAFGSTDSSGGEHESA